MSGRAAYSFSELDYYHINLIIEFALNNIQKGERYLSRIKRKIGLHLRLETTLVELIGKARRLGVDFFQCFLTLKTAGRIMPLNTSDIKEFIHLRRKFFNDIYLHVSYWVNLSTVTYNPHRLFKKELAMAKRLEFTHVIFHPGSAKGAEKRVEGIDALARTMNNIVKKEPEFTFVIENVAQGPPSIGGDLHDFRMLLEKIDQPDKISFCIDTGHAYSFGYDLSDGRYHDSFLDLVEETVGIKRVVLLHVNDTLEPMGSHIDRHQAIGEGNIGQEMLKKFVLHSRIKNIPLLAEPPIMSEDELKGELEKITSWHV